VTTTVCYSALSPYTARRIPARLVAALALAMVGINHASAQSFTSTTDTTAWNAARWNNSADGPTYTSNYTANNTVSFTSGNYNFAGMGAVINVGNIELSDNVNVTFTTGSSTFSTGGTVRTITVGNNSTFDLGSQVISTTSGTGLIKNGNGTLSTANTNSYAGGFTLNAGTVAAGGSLALGNGSLTINGGTIRSTSTAPRNFSTRFTSGITIGGNFTLGDTVNNGALIFGSTMALGANERVITLNSAATFAGNITGSGGSITKEGAGTLTLSGTNTYTGSTTISSGTLLATKALALPGYANVGRIIINGGTLGLQVGGSGWNNNEISFLLFSATKTSGAIGIDTTNGDYTQASTAFTTTTGLASKKWTEV
jgi:autotransporter-associated beta strand protein